MVWFLHPYIEQLIGVRIVACGCNQRPAYVPLRTDPFGLIQPTVVGRTVGSKLIAYKGSTKIAIICVEVAGQLE